MPGEKNPMHVKQGSRKAADDVDPRDIGRRNEETWSGPGEELHDVRKAGGGVKGTSLGGAHTGRYGPAPSKVVSNRERKPRGQDEAD